MTAQNACDGTLGAVPPALAREVSRALAACSDRAAPGASVGAGDVHTPAIPDPGVTGSELLESSVLPPDAVLDAGVHALARAVALDCSTRAAALPLLAADALVTRAMELAAERYRDPAELRGFAERVMLQLGASAHADDPADGPR